MTQRGFPCPASRPDMARASNPPYRPPQPRKAAPDMTTGPGHPPRPARRDREQARQYLTAIAVTLAVEGITCRLTPQRGTPILTIEEPGGAPNPITIVISPGTGPGFWIDCTFTWPPPASTTPGATADTVLAILNAPHPSPPPQQM